MELFTKIWKDPVWSKVIAAGITGILGILLVVVSIYFPSLWVSVSTGFTIVWSFISGHTNTPNWVLGIMAISCLILSVILFLYIQQKIKPDTPEDPYSYRSDIIEGLLWNWHYRLKAISGLISLCPKCEFQILPELINSFYSANRCRYYCQGCNTEVGILEKDVLEKLVKLRIQHALRTGTWAAKVKAGADRS